MWQIKIEISKEEKLKGIGSHQGSKEVWQPCGGRRSSISCHNSASPWQEKTVLIFQNIEVVQPDNILSLIIIC